jgi:hypothetical protein
MSDVLSRIPDKVKANIFVGLAGINLLAIFAYLGFRIDLQSPIRVYLILYAISFCIYLYAGRIVQNRIPPNNRAVAWTVFVFAVLFRIAVLHGVPSLSTDIYRYVWDGRLICHWVNPYRWSPLDPRLASYRDYAIWRPMEYKAYQTVYMPVSELFFAIGYVLFRSNLIGFKLIFMLCDIGIVGLTMAVLKKIGKDPARAIWYAWCPLPVIEVSLAGHQDVTGIVMLMLALLFVCLGRRGCAALTLAAAGLTKGFALLVAPMFIRASGKRPLVVMGLSLLYLGLPLWVFLPEFLHGMQQYLGYVHVNSGLFSLVDALLAKITPYHFNIASKLGDAAILIAVAWSVWTRPCDVDELVRRAIVVIAVCLLVVPTLFPWYVLWLLPLAAVFGKRPAASVLCLAGMVDLVYLFYVDRAVHWFVPVIEYTPVYLLIAWEIRTGYWRRAAVDVVAGESVESGVDSDRLVPDSSELAASDPVGADAT